MFYGEEGSRCVVQLQPTQVGLGMLKEREKADGEAAWCEASPQGSHARSQQEGTSGGARSPEGGREGASGCRQSWAASCSWRQSLGLGFGEFLPRHTGPGSQELVEYRVGEVGFSYQVGARARFQRLGQGSG